MMCVFLQTCDCGHCLGQRNRNVLQSQRNLQESSTQSRMELNGLRTEEAVCLDA